MSCLLRLRKCLRWERSMYSPVSSHAWGGAPQHQPLWVLVKLLQFVYVVKFVAFCVSGKDSSTLQNLFFFFFFNPLIWLIVVRSLSVSGSWLTAGKMTFMPEYRRAIYDPSSSLLPMATITCKAIWTWRDWNSPRAGNRIATCRENNLAKNSRRTFFHLPCFSGLK